MKIQGGFRSFFKFWDRFKGFKNVSGAFKFKSVLKVFITVLGGFMTFQGILITFNGILRVSRLLKDV